MYDDGSRKNTLFREDSPIGTVKEKNGIVRLFKWMNGCINLFFFFHFLFLFSLNTSSGFTLCKLIGWKLVFSTKFADASLYVCAHAYLLFSLLHFFSLHLLCVLLFMLLLLLLLNYCTHSHSLVRFVIFQVFQVGWLITGYDDDNLADSRCVCASLRMFIVFNTYRWCRFIV